MRSYLLALIAVLIFASIANAQENKLRLGIDSPYPPFAYIDKETGKLTGFDVDIADAVCKQLKVECETNVIAFDEIIPSILANKIDVGVVGMARKPEREKLVLFSDKYFRSSSIFVGLLDSVSIEGDGLKGKKIAVQSNTSQETYLREKYGNMSTIVPVQSFSNIIKAVLNKEVDIAFIDGLPGYYQLKTEEGKGLDIIGDPVKLGSGSCMVLNKKSEDLAKRINQAIQDLRSNGEYDKINRKYFEFNVY